jgi:hypothetical protein
MFSAIWGVARMMAGATVAAAVMPVFNVRPTKEGKPLRFPGQALYAG